MARPTIKDISRIAGVSPTAVSFALNQRPGVSEATRARVEEVARELGWQRSVAAAALSAGRAQAVGLVVTRPADAFTGERFVMSLIAGIERVLTARSLTLALQFVGDRTEELEVYRRWHYECRVDGVVVIDPRPGDPRPAALRELGLPAVYLGARLGTDLPGVQIDDHAAMRLLVDHFADEGYRRLAHVRDANSHVDTHDRAAAFAAHCAERDIETCPVEAVEAAEDAGRIATQALLKLPEPPAGVIFDNEVLTLGGLAAIARAGAVDEVAVASFEDSPLCRVIRPQLTALQHDDARLGALATELLLEVLDGKERRRVVEPLPPLAIRDSTRSRAW